MQIITHNLRADQADRQLGMVSDRKQKSSEKLSSGYRINRSADDAAGLSISEKMRKQIRGLNKASRNIQDGVSLVQTAEGALNEVHDILQRMNELAIQAANDTNTNLDRDAVQSEISRLRTEINRISKTTTFNTHTVLRVKQLVNIDADDYAEAIMDEQYYGVGNRTFGAVYGKKLDFSGVNSSNKEDLIGKRFYVTCSQACDQQFSFRFTDQQSSSITLSGKDVFVEIGIKDAALTNGADIVKKINDLVVGQQANIISYLKSIQASWSNLYDDIVIGHANAMYINGADIVFYSISDGPPYFPGMGLVCADDMLELEQKFFIQVSDQPYMEIALNLRMIDAGTLGLKSLDVSSFENAGKTIDKVQNAIDRLSDYRSYLGAMQNRLEKAMAIVNNTAENAQSAESKLRDADMAEETLRFSKAKILEQIGQAMVAHTSQDTDSVLRLLD